MLVHVLQVSVAGLACYKAGARSRLFYQARTHRKGERRSLSEAEGAWANMKNGLGNLAASDVDQLTAIIKNRLKSI